MLLKVGIKGVARELNIDIDEDAQQLEKRLQAALESGANLRLVDRRGSTYLLACRNLGYIEIATETGTRVGFGI